MKLEWNNCNDLPGVLDPPAITFEGEAMKKIWALAAAMLLAVGVAGVCSAGDGAVSGTGHVTIKRPPQIMRVQLALSADGKDVAEAIANLKTQQTDAKKKLTDLAATAASIEFGPMRPPSGPTAQQQYMAQIQAMSRQGRKKPAAPAPVVTLACTLKAEWPMKEGKQEEQLAVILGLQDKIKASGIGKSAKAPTPEEQEAAEEAAGMNNGAANLNEPTFTYVSKVSDEDRASATAEAFKKAKTAATQLAKAADATLGPLQKMSGGSSSAPATAENVQEMYMRMMMQSAGSAPPAEPAADDEASGSEAGPVELQITVTATFDLTK